MDRVNGTLAAVQGALKTVQAEHDPSDLAYSLGMNLFILAIGWIVFSVMRACGWDCRPDKAHTPKPVAETAQAENYVAFLEECRNLFITQTALSAVATTINGGISAMTVGIAGGTVNTAMGLNSQGLSVLCVDTVVRGLIALLYVEKLRRRIQIPPMNKRDRDQIKRTIWLSGLPKYDRETREVFKFKDSDFDRVASDLTEALQEDMVKDIIGKVKKSKIKVHVAPIVDQLHRASVNMINAMEHMDAVAAELNKYHSGCWGKARAWYYKGQYLKYSERVPKLQFALKRLEKEKKGLAGSAFVTFETVKDRDHFLKKKPKCWECRRAAYFTFGRPPFTSVTLLCKRAPHPDDVNWLNLHISRQKQVFVGFCLITSLFIVMVTLVTPLTLSSQISIIIPLLQKRVEVVAGFLHAKHMVLGQSVQFWYTVTCQLPALLLVIINSLLLPDCIYRIAEAIRLHQHSSTEIVQLHLNYIFLVLNSLFIPMLGLTSIGALVEWGEQEMFADRPAQVVAKVAKKLMQSSGLFALRYILNCACVSNTNALLQICQLVFRCCARGSARTARDYVEAELNFTFAWGYWYAWTISIFTIGVVMSTFVPSVLPCAALFFSVQHCVDRYNLLHRVYDHGPSSENYFITRALHYMRCIVCLWWSLVGGGFLLILKEGLADQWCSVVPIRIVRGTCFALLGFSAWLALWSWWDLTSILHDSNFDMVDISTRSRYRNSLLAMLEKCCIGRKKYVQVASDDVPQGLLQAGIPLQRQGESLADPGGDQGPSAWAGLGAGGLCWDARLAVVRQGPLPL